MFELGHPKHYHMFKRLMDNYRSNGNQIIVMARNKDVLLNLLKADKIKYVRFGPHLDGLLKKLLITPLLLFNYFAILVFYRPKIVFSKASPYVSFFSRALRLNHIIFPDSDGFKSNDVLGKHASLIITPDNYKDDYGPKHKRINGFFENLYLHPEVFKPNKQLLSKYGIDPLSKYIIIRLVGWGAHHDTFAKGISKEKLTNLIKGLEKHARVYLSSEGAQSKELNKYKLDIDPADIHHVLYFASAYLGDSQTMATEASLLGVPSIRTNSFVGDKDMTNFKLLEQKHGLLYNFSDPQKAFKKAATLLQEPGTKDKWQEKRQRYYKENRDVFKQILSYINDFESKT